MADRIRSLRVRMQRDRLDVFLVSSPLAIRYLTGFTGSRALCAITDHRLHFFSDLRYVDQSKEEISDVWRRRFVRLSLIEGLCATRGIVQPGDRVGFDPDAISISEYRQLHSSLKPARLVKTPHLMPDLMSIKDEEEVTHIRTAVEISERTFQKAVEIIRPGVYELDVAAEIAYWHRKLGAEKDAFDPIVASGIRAALPHARAGRWKIRRRDVVVIDLGCMVNGYASDLTRTVAVGSIPGALARAAKVVLDAQERALQAVRSGVSGRALDAVARRYIKRNALGRFFTHSLGHGVGLSVHELPRISPSSTERLGEDNVVAIEPGVYLPGIGGVRIEDMVRVRKDSGEMLTTLPRELIVL